MSQPTIAEVQKALTDHGLLPAASYKDTDTGRVESTSGFTVQPSSEGPIVDWLRPSRQMSETDLAVLRIWARDRALSALAQHFEVLYGHPGRRAQHAKGPVYRNAEDRGVITVIAYRN